MLGSVKLAETLENIYATKPIGKGDIIPFLPLSIIITIENIL
jgi:hypothetical protein